MKRRGLAFALTLTGSGVGSILAPLVTQHTMEAYYWRAAYLGLGGVALLVGFPADGALCSREAFRPQDRQSYVFIGNVKLAVCCAAMSLILMASIPFTRAQRKRSNCSFLGHSDRLRSGSTAQPLHFRVRRLGDCRPPGHRSFSRPMLCASGLAGHAGALLRQHDPAGPCALGRRRHHRRTLLGFGLGSEADVTPYWIARYCGTGRNLSMPTA